MTEIANFQTHTTRDGDSWLVMHGQKYDTRTATQVGHWRNVDFSTDNHYHGITLYRTPEGHWFYRHEYALRGFRIETVDPDEAREFIASRMRDGSEAALATYFPS
jgi:hypothetical protein